MSTINEYPIGELAKAAQVTPRTIRYYVTEGVLPPPDRAGRVATYSEEHLARLRLIKVLKDEFLPLQEIASLLAGLDRQEVLDLLAEKEPPDHLEPAVDSAKEYLQSLLNTPNQADEPSLLMRRRLEAKREAQHQILPAPDDLQSLEVEDFEAPYHLGFSGDAPPTPPASSPILAPAPMPETVVRDEPKSSHWQRIQLTPDIELHIRLGAEKQSLLDKIEQLINFARRLFR